MKIPQKTVNRATTNCINNQRETHSHIKKNKKRIRIMGKGRRKQRKQTESYQTNVNIKS